MQRPLHFGDRECWIFSRPESAGILDETFLPKPAELGTVLKETAQPPYLARFESIAVNLRSGELRKNAERIKLPEQSYFPAGDATRIVKGDEMILLRARLASSLIVFSPLRCSKTSPAQRNVLWQSVYRTVTMTCVVCLTAPELPVTVTV